MLGQEGRGIPVSEELGWRWQRCLMRGEGRGERGSTCACSLCIRVCVTSEWLSGSACAALVYEGVDAALDPLLSDFLVPSI